MEYEIGCYGDGALGHQHTRERCAEIVESYESPNPYTHARQLAICSALRRPMSDDAWEEQEACLLLEQNVSVEGAWWGWQDGDFGLWPIKQVRQ